MSVPTREEPTLLEEIRELLQAARADAARHVNARLVLTRFEVGHRIVHHEQGGEARAGYGQATLQLLSDALTEEFGRGWSVDNLALMRRFYLAYRDRLPISETLSRISDPEEGAPISETLSRTSPPAPRTAPFTLSWSHYVFLLGIDDEAERAFYEVEASRSGWSLRELRPGDRIVVDLEMRMEDFDESPFAARGGLGKVWSLFGEELEGIVEELNRELVA